MAPTTTIETITITRPLKVIAFICGLIVIILLLMALVSTDWLMAVGWRQGLFSHCVTGDAPTPLPFNVPNVGAGCQKARDAPYIKVAAGLCILGLLTDGLATLLTGLGLRSKDHRTKYKFYRIAVYVMIASLISVLLALVVYPVCFANELNEGNRTVWEFGWAYGVGWGAAIFLFGAVVLLLCDKESEEIYYKERKVVA
ncbi:transmembrane protein 47 isoform X2 [Lycorma delicatula]